MIRATGFEPTDMHLQHAWWYFLATLIGPWTVASLGASLGLIGNEKLLMQIITGTIGVLLVGVMFGSLGLSESGREAFRRFAAVCVGLGFFAATIWMIYSARRSSLIESPTIVAGFCTWLLLSASVIVVATRNGATWPAVVFGCGAAALTVAPIAAAPLAIAMNRTR